MNDLSEMLSFQQSNILHPLPTANREKYTIMNYKFVWKITNIICYKCYKEYSPNITILKYNIFVAIPKRFSFDKIYTIKSQYIEF